MTGCRQNKDHNTRSHGSKINVITTIFPPYDFVRQITRDRESGGARVNLAMLLPPGAESHSYEPSPKDIIAIQNSDVFIYVGGKTDNWVSRILQSMSADKKTLALMDTVNAVREETVEGMEEDHDDTGVVYDEHIWTSPKNAVLIVRAIAGLLCEADPANADFYKKNADDYIHSLSQLDSSFAEVVAGAKRKTIVFADRFPFRYFTDAYGLEYYAAFPGCAAETEPSAATVAFLIDKIRTEKIPVVFYIELSNERMADIICAETGVKKLLFNSCHNISKKDFDSGDDYLEIMRRNVRALYAALH